MNRCWLLICAFCFASSLYAGPLQEAFVQAVSGSDSERTARLKEIELKLQASLSQDETAEKWVDLARVLESQGHLVRAYYGAEKALLLNPNLLVAQKMAEQLAQRLGIQRPSKTMFQWIRIVPEALYGIGLMGFYAVFLWAVKTHRSGLEKVGALSLFLCFAFLLWAEPSWFGRPHEMMVLENLSVSQGPGREYSALTPLQAGAAVTPLVTQGAWVAVDLAGQAGWVPLSKLAPL